MGVRCTAQEGTRTIDRLRSTHSAVKSKQLTWTSDDPSPQQGYRDLQKQGRQHLLQMPWPCSQVIDLQAASRLRPTCVPSLIAPTLLMMESECVSVLLRMNDADDGCSITHSSSPAPRSSALSIPQRASLSRYFIQGVRVVRCEAIERGKRAHLRFVPT